MIRFALVTPTFQQASTLRQTIESVLQQDYPELDYWVIDAGSRDGTVEILREYEGDPRFHWISEPDKGQSDAINKGLARCQGDLFNWINSDDYLHPHALSRIARACHAHPKMQVFSGQTVEFSDDDPVRQNTIHLQVRPTLEETLTVGIYCQPSTFYRTEILREIGGVTENLQCVMDWEMWVRYLLRHGQTRVHLLEEVIAYYRHHAQAKTQAISSRFYTETSGIYQRLHQTLEAPEPFLSYDPEALPACPAEPYAIRTAFQKKVYLGRFADRMVRVYRQKNSSLARKWLKIALGYPPFPSFFRLKMWIRLLGKS